MQKLMRGNNRRRYDIDEEGLAPRQQGDAPSMGKEPGYWQGGSKFGARDGIAGLLAAVGDGFTNWSGGNGNAVGLLSDNRMGAMAQMEAAQRKAAEAEQFRTAAAGMGYSGPEIAAMEADVPLRKPESDFELMSVGNGAIARVNKRTGEYSDIRQPNPQAPGTLYQVDEGGRPVYRSATDAAGRPAFRAPTGGDGGPAGVTPNKRADLMAEAEKAIAAGVPRDKVEARLRAAGVM